jgi:hypothetical protein
MANKAKKAPWILGLSFAAIYLVNFFLAWPTTRWGDISNGSYLFGDFAWLSAWSTYCKVNVAIPDIFSVYSQIDSSVTCPEYNYGTILIILLSIFPIAFDHYILVAITVGLISVFALGYFLASAYAMSFWQKVIVSLAFFSPGTYLLFERGNLDLVIVLLIVIAAVLLARGALLPAYLVLVFVTLLKFYTLPLVILVALFSKTLRQRILTAILALLTVAWVVVDFSRGQALPVYGPVQFGYPVLDHYFEWLGLSIQPLPSLIGFFAPWFVWALLILIEPRVGQSVRTKLKQTVDALQDDYAFIFTGIIFCAVFFVGLNFDYRLIFLSLAGVALIMRSYFSRQMNVALWLSLFIALWGSGAIGGNFMFIPAAIKPLLVGGFQLAGDLAVFLWVGILLYVGALVVARKIKWFGRLLDLITRSKAS